MELVGLKKTPPFSGNIGGETASKPEQTGSIRLKDLARLLSEEAIATTRGIIQRSRGSNLSDNSGGGKTCGGNLGEKN